MKNSALLRAKIDFAGAPSSHTNRALWNHPDLRELLLELFFRNHCITRASVPLMEAARDRAKALGAADPLAPALVDYLDRHIPEERHHDAWLLDDLEVLGVSREAVLARTPSTGVAELVGAQYYWIFHHHPVALLGYMAVLEGYPSTTEGIDRLIASTGYPRDGFRTMIKHAVLDPHHRDDLDLALDTMALTADHRELLGLSAIRTVQLLDRTLRELLERRRPAEPRTA